MRLLAAALGLSLLGSVGGLLVASSLLLFTDRIRTKLVPWLVSYAVGALLGVSLLLLLPEALETLEPTNVFATLLAGIVAFFLLEKLVLLRHDHSHEYDGHSATATLVIVGDAFHNFIDGATVCAAAPELGAAGRQHRHRGGRPRDSAGSGRRRDSSGRRLQPAPRAAAQSRFRRRRHRGRAGRVRRRRVLPGIRPYVLAFSSASLLYIAMSDLIPDLHRGQKDRSAWRQVLLITAGIATVLLFERRRLDGDHRNRSQSGVILKHRMVRHRWRTATCK